MRRLTFMSGCILLTGVLCTSGCIVAPDRDGDRAYEHHRYDSDRDHDRREAYRHCREEGGHDCDDILHR
jgi:hypothetical protein